MCRGCPRRGLGVCHHGINVFVVCCWSLMFGSLRLPLLLLHVLQMIWPLSRVLSPPLLTGVMWSASGLVGRSCVSQVMAVPHKGHSVCPCCRAWVMSRARHRRWAADAVRLVCAITPPLLDCAPAVLVCLCDGLKGVGGYEYLALALLIDSRGCFVRLRGCLERGRVVVFYPTLWLVRKITSPPSGVKRRRTRKKNEGEGVSVSGLALSGVGHSHKVYALKVFKVFYI